MRSPSGWAVWMLLAACVSVPSAGAHAETSFNVASYGARADGTTLDTAAIKRRLMPPPYTAAL